jgi:predicted kinase
MEIRQTELPRHANVVLNRYVSQTEDLNGLSLLPLFLSCRAAVRAMTGATAVRLQPDANRGRELTEAARQYLEMAKQLLSPPPASLLAVGGFSGSGKSTLALALAPGLGPVPGAIVLRSDEIRKRLAGVPALTRLEAGAYSSSMSDRVYATMASEAASVLGRGQSVVVDAVFARPAERQAIERTAADAHVPLIGVWLDAPEATLIERVQSRRDDASDAGAEVVRMQRAGETGPIEWPRIDASPESGEIARQVADYIVKKHPQAMNGTVDDAA